MGQFGRRLMRRRPGALGGYKILMEDPRTCWVSKQATPRHCGYAHPRHEGLTGKSNLLTGCELACVRRAKIADLIERITLTVTGRAPAGRGDAPHLSVASELDDVKGIEHAGCVLELIVVLACPWKGPESRDLHPCTKLPRSSSQFCAHGARPSLGPEQQPAAGCLSSRVSRPRCR